jgi:hypothetical protein
MIKVHSIISKFILSNTDKREHFDIQEILEFCLLVYNEIGLDVYHTAIIQLLDKHKLSSIDLYREMRYSPIKVDVRVLDKFYSK